MRAVFLLLLIVPISLQTDTFIFHGFLKCKYQKQWCWRLDGHEFDMVVTNTWLGKVEGCTSEQEVEYKLEAQMNGDGPMGGNEYEVGLSVDYTCTRSGRLERIWEHRMWDLKIGAEHPYHLEKNFTLPQR